MYLKRFWIGIVLGTVIVLNFESFFFALLASVSLHYEKKLTKNIRPTDILQIYTSI